MSLAIHTKYIGPTNNPTMKKHDRVITPKGLGMVEGVHGDQITVRLIDPRFPLPEWLVYPRKQLRLVRDKKTVENYGEALY